VETTGAFGSFRVEYIRKGPNGNASSSPHTEPESSRARAMKDAASRRSRPPDDSRSTGGSVTGSEAGGGGTGAG
jgi:hypothetical protein